MNGTHAVRYYAGMRNDVMRLHVTDKLLYTECCILGSQGITEYDLMGDRLRAWHRAVNGRQRVQVPSYTEEITPVAAGRDVPIKKAFYSSLKLAKSLKNTLKK